uniref:Ig-like domain-containing protein n=1 Tax=Equus asinus asinus TaxID=83772 RepID=A0A8C4PKQ2_EQUAS
MLLLPLLCLDLPIPSPAMTQMPHILIPGTLESGRPRNLTCSVLWAREGGMPPIYSWKLAALTTLVPKTHLPSVLTLTPRPQDHGTNLTCQVNFPAAGVTVERTIQLNRILSAGPGQNPENGVDVGDGTHSLVLRGPGTRAREIQGALGGAGVTAPFTLCLCLIFLIVKTCRKKAARKAVDRNDINPAIWPALLVSDVGILTCSLPTTSPRGDPKSCSIRHVQK